jgi:hypothetical protein
MIAKRCYSTAEAITYLGIKRRSFETHILPLLKGKGVRIGNCVVFEVRDLDAAWESYKMAAGSERSGAKGENTWDAPKRREYTGRKTHSTSTSTTAGNAFDNAASRLINRQKAG